MEIKTITQETRHFCIFRSGRQDNGENIEVETAKSEVKTLPKAEVLECNPPKFEKVSTKLSFSG